MSDKWDEWSDSLPGEDQDDDWDWPDDSVKEEENTIVPLDTTVVEEGPSCTSARAISLLIEERSEHYFKGLKAYLQDLADPCVREKINEVLTSRTYAGLTEYYKGRNDLATYTIEVEVHRMKYEVETEEGIMLSGKEDVREHLTARGGHDPLVLMANQSIFADMFEARMGICVYVSILPLSLHAYCLLLALLEHG
ncbi:unnamed protein product [Choristocarpus tenellus]